MLNLLIDYAKTHALTIEPGFKPKTIRWAIVCDVAGHFLNVQELGNSDVRNNRGQTFDVCPDLSLPEMKAGGPGCRHFLVDNVEVVALMGKNGDVLADGTIDEKEKKKAKAKHDFFISLLRQGASAMKELDALATLLDSSESLSEFQRAFTEQRFKPTDSVTFAIAGRTPMFLVEDNAWHNWWRGFRQSLLAKKSAKKRNSREQTTDKSSATEFMRCFGSGGLAEPTPTHPTIEGLSDVGGSPMQDRLASFKQESFQSYFLSQSQNAAVSEEMAAAYRAGLNHLIGKHAQQIAGAKVVHWYAGETKVEKQEDLMGLLDDSLDLSWLAESTDEEKERDALHQAKLLLGALKSGENPRLERLANYRYYAMILSANSGRVVAREWIEGRFGELAESIVAWFEALEITNLSGDRSAKSPKIERIITCLLPPIKPGQKYADWIKPIGGERTRLWHAAVSRKVEIPYKVMSRLIPLHQAFMLSGDFEEALDERSPNRAKNLSILYTRMGLLKAYHIRKGDKNMQKPYLNEEHPHPAYHCGRSMAILAEIQQAALGNVGAGVVQRYYAAASATPALVLGRLVRTSNYHMEKIGYRKKRDGLKDLHTGVWCRLKDEVPQILTLKEQSLFALGFYQQLGKLASIDWAKYKPQFTTSEEGE